MKLVDFLTTLSSKDRKHHQTQAEIIKCIACFFSDDGRFQEGRKLSKNYEDLVEELEQTTIGYLNTDEFVEMFRYFIRSLMIDPRDEFYQKRLIWDLEDYRKKRLGTKRFFYS